MDQRTLPMPRLAPLPPETTPELKAQFDATQARMGFVPNSFDADHAARSKADAGLCADVGRRVAPGQQGRSQAEAADLACRKPVGRLPILHGAYGRRRLQARQKLDEVWSYQTSPLYTPAERATLDVAVAAGCVPNAVTDEMFAELRKHWSEEQIVEIVGVIALFGFLNRWNDTFATPLEDDPLHFGEAHLAAQGWDAGKHRR